MQEASGYLNSVSDHGSFRPKSDLGSQPSNPHKGTHLGPFLQAEGVDFGETTMSLHGQEYVVRHTLYSQDGKRSAKICEFDNGETYLDEQEWVAGTTFANRHGNRLIGPFKSPEEAESFIVATDWFRGHRP